jgi:formylglycine-generating enzyme required for sulfatase activity
MPDPDLNAEIKALKARLAELESKAASQAEMQGDGAIAQGDHPVAIGAGGTYVKGDYHAPDPQQAERERSEAARLTYLEKLRRHCQVLPLATLGGEEGCDDDLTLDQVYVELNTDLTLLKTDLEKLRQGQKIDLHRANRLPESDEERKNSTPLPAWDAVLATPRVVLLGEPGAGKSTFVRKLVGIQAAVQLGQCSPLSRVAPELIPVLVVLREWVPVLRNLNLDALPDTQKNETLRAAFKSYLDSELRRLNAVDFSPHLWQAVEAGQVLLVLDGLDEVPQDLRKRVRHAMGALIAGFQLKRVILTCRIRSYSGEAVFPNLPVFTLRGFDKEQIGHFVQAWYNAQAEKGQVRGEKEERIRDLTAAATSADLREIASNPMMLTSMALIHQKEVGLPKQRVRLYKLVVEILAQCWQKHKHGQLGDFLSDSNRLLPALEHLAYAAHSAGQGQNGAADLLRKDAIAILESPDHLGGPGPAGEFLDYVDQRAGLLKGNGGDLQTPTSYSFPHRTFQEYLAGCYLVRGRSGSAAREIARHAAQGDTWTLAVQLGAEELLYNRRSPEDMLDLAYQLCPTPTPTGEPAQRAALWSGLIATIAGAEKISADHDSPNGGPAYLERLRVALVHILGSDLPPRERAEAGRVMGRLGDPRIEVMTCEAMEFCHVPEGEFIFGEGKGQKTLSLPEFWIGKNPITQAQFGQFVQAGGYTQTKYWTEAIKADAWKESGFRGRTAPFDYGEPRNLPNHPVIGVSWYEALAFTRWLNEQMGAWAKRKNGPLWQGLITGKLQIALPNEEQWEKAARGPAVARQKPRDYPWVGKFDPNKANTYETGISTTTAVGCFPKGESPLGAQDLSGNVWEGTSSPYRKSTYVLRGGAFYFHSDHARCACRFGGDPDVVFGFGGFRVVCSPFFSH